MTTAAPLTPLTPLALDGSSVDGDLYVWTTDLARRAPAPLDGLVSGWSTYGLALFAVLMLAAWWRARAAADPARTAMALAAPLVVSAAFLVDTGIKSVFREQRPCQTLHTLTLEACPPLGDWSLPSNHAAVAAAAATALWAVDRRIAALAVPAALLMAASRVWVGAHYPHDVLLGLAVGAAVSWPLIRAARRATPAVGRLARTPLRPLVAAR
ncbi:phosphatase PAP2 family protein [Streptomyces subrutilus]|uniref:Phosphatase PAP2 family protein n=1 Tax=Streptomyces subrutilus TaxID=36818 RepID=A0A5P2UEE9_9ACTN|nr:phosphatase PAP2 family protein [Streptomyces subrutilus]QEU77666.1 phosphatase PAP2 family protein [Streptomyces subrutilus]WSJ33233.1 phosphatase PAP2 family protein [Streptomyces subrutilus]GGZ65104.1 phosphatase PAP2 family protein [Streptomyces subrutilus]